VICAIEFKNTVDKVSMHITGKTLELK